MQGLANSRVKEGQQLKTQNYLCVQRAAFVGVDEEFYRAVHAREGPLCDAGATALAALVWGRALFVANAGDSRAVLSRRGRAVELSTDHKPTCQAELARIMSAGTGLWVLISEVFAMHSKAYHLSVDSS